MEVQVKEFTIQTENGNSIAVSKFSAKASVKHSIVISSATGVLQKYYANFAKYCATKGINVYTFDYGGIGNSISSIADLKNYSGNLQSWGKYDQATVVALARKEHPDETLTLITHSVGGQILGFNPNYKLLDKVLMVASQGGYYKHFEGLHRPKMLLFWYVILPFLTFLTGYFPAKKLGLFENLPKNMSYEWASWGRQKEYMMHFKNDGYMFEQINVPILSWSFPKDPFASKIAVDWMMKQYKNAQITRMHYPKEHKKQPKHFGFFKSAFKELLWEQNLNWILTNSVL